MINKIALKNIASFKEQVEMKPKKINYIYGSNGSGKTTISRILSGKISGDNCSYNNSGGSEILVYNKDFVDENFTETIKGIFTLGEESTEIKKEVEEKRIKQSKLNDEIDSKEKQIQDKRTEKEELTSNIEERLWELQKKYGKKFPDALEGVRGSKKVFANRLFKEFNTYNTKKKITNMEDIEEKYKTVFSKENVLYNEIEEIINEDVKLLYEDSIVKKRIVGSRDSQIGKFIDFLNNSDWVRKGQDYLKKSNNTCPFCQQELPNDFKKQLVDYFDESYKKEIFNLKNYQSNYAEVTRLIEIKIGKIVENYSEKFDLNNLLGTKDKLLLNLYKNDDLIKEKINNPSKSINLIEIKENIQSLNVEIEILNNRIKKNNKEVENETQEKENCKEMIWDSICNDALIQIQQFKKKNRGLDKAIKSIADQFESKKEAYNDIEEEITSKELKLSSVKPTVVKINEIIKQFGFNNFKIAENSEEKGTYKIIRPDGENARKTLSEGEYRFITFLYFYNLIYGSKTSKGIGKDKIIVIDDPISSLDSNVLFIVNTLVKKLIKDCLKEKNGIKQIILFTHNIYFHKEVTFLGKRYNPPENTISFWILKKSDYTTIIENHEDNPIKSSYEFLWESIRKPENLPNPTIFNTLRRVLEYYFKIIGGIDIEECIEKFDGEEKLICKSLISLINDQSHDIYDDLYVCLDTKNINTYLKVFKDIFYNNNQSQHYNMMMKIDV